MRDIDKNVKIIGLVSFLTDLASYMINPIIPIYVVVILKSGVDKLGIIVAISTFISYFLRLISGYISDRYGIVKPLVVSGYLISAVSKPLLYLTHTWQDVAILRGTERIGKAARSAPRDVLISYYSQENMTGRTFGFHKTLDVAGELSGAVIIFLILKYFGQSEHVIRGIFLFTIFPGLLAVLLVIFFVKDISLPRVKGSSFRLSASDRQLIFPLTIYFLFTFFIFDEAFFILRSQNIGFSLATVPLLVIAYELTQTILSYRIGLLFDRLKHSWLFTMSYLSGVIAIFLFMFSYRLLTWFGFIMFGIYSITIINTFRAYISEKSTNKGSLYGIFYTGNAISGALGVLVSGYIWQNFSGFSALCVSLAGAASVLIINLVYAEFKNYSLE